ncbi:phosphatase PAP2 family protein [Clostridium sp. YIM B02555]|uniref:phosphatase PAP2 family protein n=1 Tax=Clostridium sp. YIM B02555 TaxID=2911968 RepID=UPI001EED0249|nr:phosphatase PAP2 family protein [Clostridium sp. YIM B02555]
MHKSREMEGVTLEGKEIFTDKFIKITLVVMAGLLIVGTIFDKSLAFLASNTNSYWAAFLQDAGAIPNVIIPVLAGEIIYQKSKRLETNAVIKVICCTFAFLFPLTRFWDYFIEMLGQVGQAIMNYQAGAAVGISNKYKFVVDNSLNGIMFIIGYIVLYAIFHLLIQKFWLNKLEDRQVSRLVFIGIAGVFIDTATAEIVNQIKDYISRPRPLLITSGKEAFESWFNINGMLGKGDYTSFPSGHTRCFVMSFFLPLFVNPANFNLKKKIMIFAIIYSVIGGFSRLVMEKHFLTDVTMAGLIAVIGIFCVVKLCNLEKEKFL